MAKLNDDFHDLLSILCAEKVRFLVIGTYAVAVHGRPRTTKDIDVWVEASQDNAARVFRALRAFGAPLGDLREEELHHEVHWVPHGSCTSSYRYPHQDQRPCVC